MEAILKSQVQEPLALISKHLSKCLYFVKTSDLSQNISSLSENLHEINVKFSLLNKEIKALQENIKNLEKKAPTGSIASFLDELMQSGDAKEDLFQEKSGSQDNSKISSQDPKACNLDLKDDSSKLSEDKLCKSLDKFPSHSIEHLLFESKQTIPKTKAQEPPLDLPLKYQTYPCKFKRPMADTSFEGQISITNISKLQEKPTKFKVSAIISYVEDGAAQSFETNFVYNSLCTNHLSVLVNDQKGPLHCMFNF